MRKISRKEALNKGLKTYFTGKPCKKGHVCERDIARHCIMCHKHNKTKSNKKYRKNHKEYFKQYCKQYRKDNKEKIKQYQENNKEHIKQTKKQWRKNNPEKVAIGKERRRGYLKESIPIWYEVNMVKQLYLKRNELNEKWSLNLQVDHIIPIISNTVCGLHCWANLQLLDSELNNSKNNNYQQDW